MARDFAGAPSLLTMDSPTVTLEESKIKKIELPGKQGDFDYNEEIKQMSRQMKESEKDYDSLTVAEIDLDFGKLAKVSDIETVSNVEKLIQQAKALIKKKKFEEALGLLEKVYSEEPGNPEAVYLEALCHKGLNNAFAALKGLSRLRVYNLERKLEIKVNQLLEKIRMQIEAELLLKSLILKKANLSGYLYELIELDPDFEYYYFHLSVLLLEQDRLHKAYECVLKGVENKKIPAKRKRILTSLKNEIERRLLIVELEPAIELYKKGSYNKAGRALLNVDHRLWRSKEYNLLSSYLLTLKTGPLNIFRKKIVTDVEIKGTAKDRGFLQSVIIEKEITTALFFINNGDFLNAEKWLMKGMEYAPSFPFVNFLLAGCIYNKTIVSMLTRQLPPVELVIDELKTAKHHAQVGSKDSTIDGSKQLMASIDSILSMFNQVKEVQRKRQEEINQVNGVIKEFMAIMKNADRQFTSIGEFESVYDRMKKLKTDSLSVKQKVTFQENIDAVGELIQAIDKNLDVLKSIEKTIEEQRREMQLAEAPQMEYGRIMASIKDGIQSESQLNTVESSLKRLREEIKSYKRKAKTDQVKDALTQLCDRIDDDLKQIAKISRDQIMSTADKTIVDNHVKLFNGMMSSLNSGNAIKSRDDLNTWIDLCSTFLKNLERDKNKVNSRAARETVSKLHENVRNMKNQLESYL